MTEVRESVAAIVFLIMGIGIATLVLIFVGVLSGSVYSASYNNINMLSNEISNENSSAVNILPVTITAASSYIYPGSETLVAKNTTHTFGTLTRNINYTVTSYDTGQFSIIDLAKMNSTITVITLSYTIGNPLIERNITGAIQNSFTSISTVGNYTPIIVLAVIIFIVLGLVMSLTPGFSRGQMPTSLPL